MSMSAGNSLASSNTPVTDASVLTFPMADYLFLGVSQAVTFSGIFVDATGAQVGNSFTASVPQGNGTNNPVSIATIAGISIPNNAVAVAAAINSNLYFSLANGQATPTADFKANYVNYPQKLAGDGALALGKIF